MEMISATRGLGSPSVYTMLARFAPARAKESRIEEPKAITGATLPEAARPR